MLYYALSIPGHRALEQLRRYRGRQSAKLKRIEIAEDGSIAQVEITSCGLNGTPLVASGTYPASIACHLTDRTTMNRIDYENPVMRRQIRITQEGYAQHITSVSDGAVIGYKYFDFCEEPEDREIALELRGHFTGTVRLLHEPDGANALGAIEIAADTENWMMVKGHFSPNRGKQPLYFRFEGTGVLDIRSFCFC